MRASSADRINRDAQSRQKHQADLGTQTAVQTTIIMLSEYCDDTNVKDELKVGSSTDVSALSQKGTIT